MSSKILCCYKLKKDNKNVNKSTEFLRLRGGGYSPMGFVANTPYVCLPSQPPCIPSSNYNMIPALVYLPDNSPCGLPPIFLTYPYAKNFESTFLSQISSPKPALEASETSPTYELTSTLGYPVHNLRREPSSNNAVPSFSTPIAASSALAQHSGPVAASTPLNQPSGSGLMSDRGLNYSQPTPIAKSTPADLHPDLQYSHLAPVATSTPPRIPASTPIGSPRKPSFSIASSDNSKNALQEGRNIILTPIKQTDFKGDNNANNSSIKVIIKPTSSSDQNRRFLPSSKKIDFPSESTKTGSFNLKPKFQSTPKNNELLRVDPSNSLRLSNRNNAVFDSTPKSFGAPRAFSSPVEDNVFKSLLEDSSNTNHLQSLTSNISNKIAKDPTDKDRLLHYQSLILGLWDMIQKKKQSLVEVALLAEQIKEKLEQGDKSDELLEFYQRCTSTILLIVQSLEADLNELKQLKTLHRNLLEKMQAAGDDCVIQVEYAEPTSPHNKTENYDFPVLQTILFPSTADLLDIGYSEKAAAHVEDAHRSYKRAKELQDHILETEKDPRSAADEEEKRNLEKMMHSFFQHRRNAIEHLMKAGK